MDPFASMVAVFTLLALTSSRNWEYVSVAVGLAGFSSRGLNRRKVRATPARISHTRQAGGGGGAGPLGRVSRVESDFRPGLVWCSKVQPALAFACLTLGRYRARFLGLV